MVSPLLNLLKCWEAHVEQVLQNLLTLMFLKVFYKMIHINLNMTEKLNLKEKCILDRHFTKINLDLHRAIKL